jgi:hypothetical protein
LSAKLVPILRVEGVAWSAQRIPMAVNPLTMQRNTKKSKYIYMTIYLHTKFTWLSIILLFLSGCENDVQKSGLLCFYTRSSDRYSKERNVSETVPISVLCCVVGEATTLLGPLERANLNHWTARRKQVQLPKRSIIQSTGRRVRSKNSVIPILFLYLWLLWMFL